VKHYGNFDRIGQLRLEAALGTAYALYCENDCFHLDNVESMAELREALFEVSGRLN
jgi:hypothetical protein